LKSWWARQDSNLQPSGYERAELNRKRHKINRLRIRLIAFSAVRKPRFIGYSLVGKGKGSVSNLERPDRCTMAPGGTVRQLVACALMVALAVKVCVRSFEGWVGQDGYRQSSYLLVRASTAQPRRDVIDMPSNRVSLSDSLAQPMSSDSELKNVIPIDGRSGGV